MTSIDVIARLLEAGPDAHLFLRIDISGKIYDLSLQSIEVSHFKEMPNHVTFKGTKVRTDLPIPVEGDK